MITMTEIARLTGVSQPTVSRVLNGNTAVNPEIRERVLACAREHDFQPNVIAQSLVGSKTRLIGVIVTDISNSFFAELVKHIGEEARKDGYSLILFSSDYDLEKEKECLDVVKRYRVDGLIMVPVDENGAEWRGMVSRLDIPTVVITRHATGIDSFYVALMRQVHRWRDICVNRVMKNIFSLEIPQMINIWDLLMEWQMSAESSEST